MQEIVQCFSGLTHYLIVHWLSWRDIFFVNVPVGIVALILIYYHMPDYRAETRRPLDATGMVLFGGGAALLSWLLEIFGEHQLDTAEVVVWLLVALGLLLAYVWHAARIPHPLLRLALFRIRTFRVSVVGGFITRMSMGGLPFLLPLLYQVGLGMPAWQSGLLMMPMALAAMGMKVISTRVLKHFGYRRVLVVNTLAIGVAVSLYALVTPTTPIFVIVLIGLGSGLFNALQFTSMNSIAYADIDSQDSSMASTMTSTFQQMSMSFGLASGTLITAWYLGNVPQSNQTAVTTALHHAFLTIGVLTLLSSLTFWTLRPDDGASVSGKG